ncbi:hypothetical protein J2755_001294 [Methanohalophilus levihalophilus]|uniref:hypothetical protein n=1 Tax=Methanohalophilus levihalophilus TaxID=1431282 RepID=UPI001AE5EE17|nr:hypothetical protein [Methanohalophilus levihalophilus]MBP2030360.1 hypothetical protein [Methanohalophilus levihalophilus]
MELNEKMYYACSLCSTENKVVWHRPKTQTWRDHKQYIDLDQTNSETPQYFWCRKHNLPHSLKRECLPYKATVTLNGKIGDCNGVTNQLSHNDVLKNIRYTVAKKSKQIDWKKAIGSNSLPYPCNRDTRLILPDIIYCKKDNSTNSSYTVTNIIEFETKTAPEIIVDKVERFKRSFSEMVRKNYQNPDVLPRIIFLYDKQTEVYLPQISKMFEDIEMDSLESVCIGYYENNEKWYQQFFMDA